MWPTTSSVRLTATTLNAASSSTSNASRRALRRGLATEVSPSISLSDDTPSLSHTPRTLPYKLYTSLILARAPLLTPTPTAFESSYRTYQARIHRALSTPFPTEFYFKKGSLTERRFLAEERVREQAAFGEGFEGDERAERIEDVPKTDEEDVKFLERNDGKKDADVRDLNRMGERSLYLLVKERGAKNWRFPVWSAGLEQPLHKTIQGGLIDSFGPNMNTWLVSRQPIAVTSSSESSPSKTFFFKGRILAGRPSISSSSEVAWLTKEEIAERVEGTYWADVRDVIPRV